MNPAHVPDDLQDILDAYMATAEIPSYAVLQEWIARYPHYQQELTDFTVRWSRLEALPLTGGPVVADESLVRYGVSIVESVLNTGQADATLEAGRAEAALEAGQTEAPLTSLVRAGQARGLTPAQLAAVCGFGVVLMRKLERRLIRFASIRRDAIEAIAAGIGYDPEAVARYLQGAPTIAESASYYAHETPHAAEPEDFADAVRADPSMTPEQRRRWLDQS